MAYFIKRHTFLFCTMLVPHHSEEEIFENERRAKSVVERREFSNSLPLGISTPKTASSCGRSRWTNSPHRHSHGCEALGYLWEFLIITYQIFAVSFRSLEISVNQDYKRNTLSDHLIPKHIIYVKIVDGILVGPRRGFWCECWQPAYLQDCLFKDRREGGPEALSPRPAGKPAYLPISPHVRIAVNN